MIHELADVEDGAIIGEGTKVGRWTHIESGAVIGKDCVIGQSCFIGGCVEISDGCIIENNVSVCDGVRIYSDVFIGSSVVFMNIANRHTEDVTTPKYDYRATFINKGVSVGANATIYCGTTVSEDVLPGEIVKE